ncbi:MAG: roadblock/LC7 domain-containing protein [Rhodocyclaceae bacterium]
MKARNDAEVNRVLSLVFDAKGDPARVPQSDELGFADSPLSDVSYTGGGARAKECFRHTSFQRVLDGILSHVHNNAPVIVATGEPGCGKTVLTHCLLDYPAEGVIPLVFDNRQSTFEEFLESACRHFRLGGTPIDRDGSFSERFRMFWDYLLSQRSRGRSVMIVADDAQKISEGLLGELALLSEWAKDGKPVLQMVLVGSQSVHKLLDSLVVRGFIKKKYPTFELTPLKSGDIGLFIDSQISTFSEGPRYLFPPESVDKIAAYSRGVPRSILALCGLAVFKAKLEKRDEITADLIEAAAQSAIDGGETLHCVEPQPPAEPPRQEEPDPPRLPAPAVEINQEEPQMTRLESLNKILKNLQNESPGVEASALISEDGLMIASALSSELDETRIGGMTATLLNLGTRAATELRRGEVEEVIVRGEAGYAVMVSAGRGVLLLVLANENSKLGLIFFDMREAIKNIRKVL